MEQQGARSPGARINRRQFDETSGETRSAGSRLNRERGNISPSVNHKFDKMTVEDIDHGDKRVMDEPDEEKSCFKKDTSARSRCEGNEADAADEIEAKKDEEEAPKKSLKKTTGTGAGRKRKEKKNLREKRRSTGVVIMPGQATDPCDEQAQTVAKNTAANTGEVGVDCNTSNADVSSYQETILQLQDELAAKVKELDTVRSQMDTLRNQNTRLKDENSALLRVVGSLSGTGGGR